MGNVGQHGRRIHLAAFDKGEGAATVRRQGQWVSLGGAGQRHGPNHQFHLTPWAAR